MEDLSDLYYFFYQCFNISIVKIPFTPSLMLFLDCFKDFINRIFFLILSLYIYYWYLEQLLVLQQLKFFFFVFFLTISYVYPVYSAPRKLAGYVNCLGRKVIDNVTQLWILRVIDFCVLIFYFSSSLNTFIRLKSFLMDSIGFLISESNT